MTSREDTANSHNQRKVSEPTVLTNPVKTTVLSSHEK